MTINLIVDPEVKSIIPQITTEEYQQLEANLLADGCRDALVAWQGILLDGHNRLEICQRHNLPCEIKSVDLPDKGDAIKWVVQNQLGRRNLTPFQRAELALKLKPIHEKGAEERRQQAGKLYHRSSPKVLQNSAEPLQPVDTTREELAKLAGVSHDTITKAEVISAQADEDTKQKLRKGEMTMNQAYMQVRRIQRQEDIQNVPHFPRGKYQVVYADPPWQYNNSGLGGAAESHYPTMSMDGLARLDLASLTGEDAILFLWVTSPFLPEGLRLCQAWGFEYKTTFVWIKDKSTYGKLGFYNYGQHEFLFVATRGSCLPQSGTLEPSVLFAPKRGHSEKPEAVYELIERMYPGPYIELFARKTRSNWAAWGTL